jgi:hypothetical protein
MFSFYQQGEKEEEQQMPQNMSFFSDGDVGELAIASARDRVNGVGDI